MTCPPGDRSHVVVGLLHQAQLQVVAHVSRRVHEFQRPAAVEGRNPARKPARLDDALPNKMRGAAAATQTGGN